MAGGGVSEDGDAGFQIAPMVDVVFVLLLFFMASAGSKVKERELTINLPSGKPNNSGVASTPIIIEIGPDGTVQSSGRVFDTPTSREMPALRQWLTETIDRFGDKDPVIIKPDPEAKHERIIDVLNSAAVAKVKKLTFG